MGCGRRLFGAPDQRARSVAWRRRCSPARPFSISPWKRGPLVRSPAYRCAAAHLGSARGRDGWPGGGPFATGAHPHSSCACGGAGNLLRRERFQPARGSVGRWPGHQHGGAPPTKPESWSGAGGFGMVGWGRSFATGASTQRTRAVAWRSRCPMTRTPCYGTALCHRSTHSACACGGADDVLRRARFQPARGCVGRWPGHQHGGAPPGPRREREGLGWFPRARPLAAGFLCHWGIHSAYACGGATQSMFDGAYALSDCNKL